MLNSVHWYLQSCGHISGVTNKLQNQQDSRQNLEQELNTKMSSLTKERDDLLDLAMQRGKLIQVGWTTYVIPSHNGSKFVL